MDDRRPQGYRTRPTGCLTGNRRQMAYDFVTVNMSVTSLEGSTGAIGSLHFEVSDFVLDMSTGAIIIVPPIHLEGNGGFTGNGVSVPFLAMDGANISHNWYWVLVSQVDDRLTA